MIPVKILAVRYLANASPSLGKSLGAPAGYPSLGLLTTDSDDAMDCSLPGSSVHGIFQARVLEWDAI